MGSWLGHAQLTRHSAPHAAHPRGPVHRVAARVPRVRRAGAGPKRPSARLQGDAPHPGGCRLRGWRCSGSRAEQVTAAVPPQPLAPLQPGSGPGPAPAPRPGGGGEGLPGPGTAKDRARPSGSHAPALPRTRRGYRLWFLFPAHPRGSSESSALSSASAGLDVSFLILAWAGAP